MKIATFQMSAFGNHSDRPDRIEAALQEAAAVGAKLLIAPELALSGYGRGSAFSGLAQEAGGDWYMRLRKKVEATGVSLIAGFPEMKDGNRHISGRVIDAATDAAPVIYRKACLYGAYEKDHFQSPGPSTVFAELSGLRIGILICYDVEFPENTRRLARAGVDLIAVPTALPRGAAGAFIASHVIRTRAFENQVHIAYCNHADSDDMFTYQGCSSIVAPDGAVLAQAAATGDAMLYASIDPAAYVTSREENPYLNDAVAAGL